MSDISTEWREIRPKLGDLICHIDSTNQSIDAKMIKLQKKDNEAYQRGLQDMYESIRLIAADESDGGMPIFELDDAFGTSSVCDIIFSYPPQEIMDKTLEWATKRKESQELCVGDEVMTGDCFTGIVTHIGAKTVWIVYKIIAGALGFDSRLESKDHCKKTGRHFDNIPFDYDPEKEKETI